MAVFNSQILEHLAKCGIKLSNSSNLFGRNIFRGCCVIGNGCDICSNVFGHFTCVGNFNSLFNSVMGNYSTISNCVHMTMGRHALHEFSTSEAFCENYIFLGYPNSRQNSVMRQYKSRFMSARLGHDVLIKDHVVIPCDIEIGDGAIIEAGAVVTKNVPPYAIVSETNRIIGQRFSDEIIADLQCTRWWEYNLPLAAKQGLFNEVTHKRSKDIPHDGCKVEPNELLNESSNKPLHAVANDYPNEASNKPWYSAQEGCTATHKYDEPTVICNDNGNNDTKDVSSSEQHSIQANGQHELYKDENFICRFPQTPSELIAWFAHVDRSCLTKLPSSGYALDSDNKFISFTPIEEQDS